MKRCSITIDGKTYNSLAKLKEALRFIASPTLFHLVQQHGDSYECHPSIKKALKDALHERLEFYNAKSR